MRRVRLWCVLVAGLWLVPAPAAEGQDLRPGFDPGPSPACHDGRLSSGALSRICLPESWNGTLIVYAHGYVPADAPLDFYNLDLPDGASLPALVTRLGFAFATTSFRQNGLGVLEGAEDIRDLVGAFNDLAPIPAARVIVTGVSQGAAIAARVAETSPDIVAAGLAVCGPVGSLRHQINHVGDFRVLFDYVFPGLLPGLPTLIPAELRANWWPVYVPRIRQALEAQPGCAFAQ